MQAFLVMLATRVVLAGAPSHAGAASILDLRAEAHHALQAQRWSEAAALYRELATAAEDDGAVWSAYGLALLRSGRYPDAIDAYRRALDAGVAPAVRHYDIACAHALAGETEPAVDAIERAYGLGFVDGHLIRSDPDLVSLHGHHRFRQIVGWPDASVTDRGPQWSADLAFLARRLREVHWAPFAHIAEGRFDQALADIVASIDGRTDGELRADVQRLLAAVGDGHTGIVSGRLLLHHGPSPDGPFLLPVELFHYDDGIRIVATTPDLTALLGARVLSIDGVDVGELVARLEPYVSRDNAWGARWASMRSLADPVLLAGLGVGSLDDGFPLRVARRDGRIRKVLLQAGGPDHLPTRRMVDLPGATIPIAATERSAPLWLAPIPRHRALYVRIDAIADTPAESFAAFTSRIFATAASADLEVLILDLRNNPGGEGHLTKPLLHALIASERFNRDRHLYVLVGRQTFSAAMALAAQLEVHTEARFVGEPTGSRPNFVGESSIVVLPYSGLSVSLSSRYHQNGDAHDHRLWIPPDVPAPPSWAAEREGRDPAVEAVLAIVAAGHPPR